MHVIVNMRWAGPECDPTQISYSLAAGVHNYMQPPPAGSRSLMILLMK